MIQSDHRRARDAATLDFYSRSADTYVASGPRGASRFLSTFLAMLRPNSRILELGCGGGRDAEAMFAAGFDVEPTDGTPEIAAEAAKRLGRQVRVMRFDELEVSAAYDAVWASASLLHVPRDALPDVLRRVFAALKPGGLHFASYKAGGAEGRDGFGRYFNYLSPADVARVYALSAPWSIESITEYQGGGYDGRPGPWVAIIARRPFPEQPKVPILPRKSSM
jgi:SAM-dependent methyltransferase